MLPTKVGEGPGAYKTRGYRVLTREISLTKL